MHIECIAEDPCRGGENRHGGDGTVDGSLSGIPPQLETRCDRRCCGGTSSGISLADGGIPRGSHDTNHWCRSRRAARSLIHGDRRDRQGSLEPWTIANALGGLAAVVVNDDTSRSVRVCVPSRASAADPANLRENPVRGVECACEQGAAGTGVIDVRRAAGDGRRFELCDGALFLIPSPLPRHQVVQSLLMDVLRGYTRKRGGWALHAPLEVVFSEYDILQPDALLFRAERAHLVDLDAAIRHAPDLCVDIVSPLPAAADPERKSRVYARHGVREYWLVEPAAGSVAVHELTPQGYRLVSTATADGAVRSCTLPGLAFAVCSILP